MQLSNEQLAVVNANDKKIIVDAGSGSGKTRVLVERVKRLISTGSDPSKIVVITYTNMAAGELISRLSDVKGADRCFIGTIHSYAYKLLQRVDATFEIFTEKHQTKFMKYLIEKYGYRCTFSDYEDLVKYERLVASGRMSANKIPEKFSDISVYNELMNLLGRGTVYGAKETVVTLCRDNNVLTFDDLIKHVTESGSIPKIDHLFVDEFQDVGYLEYNFLLRLNAQNYFVIGDDFQSIFAWDGGDVQIFLSLMKNKDWKQYILSENYRTAKSILSYATSIVKKANDIIDKPVTPMREEQGTLQFITKSTLSKQAKELSSGEWFFLVRTNKEMRAMCGELKKMGLNFNCVSHGEIIDSGGDNQDKNITVMTIHSSKGLECENVALYGKFPVNGKGQSEEIKVFYVGLTRSINKCIVFI